MSVFRSVVGIGICLSLFVSCSTGKKTLTLKPLEVKGALRLELKALPGRVEKMKYHSHTRISNYEEGQIVRQKEESVDFQIQTEHPQKSAIKENLIPLVITTIQKDGLMSLHDLAFPEEGEVLEIFLNKRAHVIRAGDFPSNSVFYIPPVPLPKEPVSVGDTWRMKSSWVNYKSGTPLAIDLVAIFKNIYSCGKQRCADIEISGSVYVTGALAERVQFRSQIGGRLLFSIEQGTIVWSHVQSQEEALTPNGQVKVRSCLFSQLIEPTSESLPLKDPFTCDPLKRVNQEGNLLL